MYNRGRAATAQKEQAPLVGSVWFKTSKKGTDYASISINLAELGLGEGYLNLVGFYNKESNDPKFPNMRLQLSEPTEKAAVKPAAARTVGRAAVAKTTAKTAVQDSDSEETPF